MQGRVHEFMIIYQLVCVGESSAGVGTQTITSKKCFISRTAAERYVEEFIDICTDVSSKHFSSIVPDTVTCKIVALELINDSNS